MASWKMICLSTVVNSNPLRKSPLCIKAYPRLLFELGCHVVSMTHPFADCCIILNQRRHCHPVLHRRFWCTYQIVPTSSTVNCQVSALLTLLFVFLIMGQIHFRVRLFIVASFFASILIFRRWPKYSTCYSYKFIVERL